MRLMPYFNKSPDLLEGHHPWDVLPLLGVLKFKFNQNSFTDNLFLCLPSRKGH
jgi:hypothetical protein